MRQLIQGSIKPTTVPSNAKFLVIVGRKVEAVWFPHTMSPDDVKRVLIERQEILPDTRVIRG